MLFYSCRMTCIPLLLTLSLRFISTNMIILLIQHISLIPFWHLLINDLLKSHVNLLIFNTYSRHSIFPNHWIPRQYHISIVRTHHKSKWLMINWINWWLICIPRRNRNISNITDIKLFGSVLQPTRYFYYPYSINQMDFQVKDIFISFQILNAKAWFWSASIWSYEL